MLAARSHHDTVASARSVVAISAARVDRHDPMTLPVEPLRDTTPLLPALHHAPAEPLQQPSPATAAPRRESPLKSVGARLGSRASATAVGESTVPTMLDLASMLERMSTSALSTRLSLLERELERVRHELSRREDRAAPTAAVVEPSAVDAAAGSGALVPLVAPGSSSASVASELRAVAGLLLSANSAATASLHTRAVGYSPMPMRPTANDGFTRASQAEPLVLPFASAATSNSAGPSRHDADAPRTPRRAQEATHRAVGSAASQPKQPYAGIVCTPKAAAPPLAAATYGSATSSLHSFANAHPDAATASLLHSGMELGVAEPRDFHYSQQHSTVLEELYQLRRRRESGW